MLGGLRQAGWTGGCSYSSDDSAKEIICKINALDSSVQGVCVILANDGCKRAYATQTLGEHRTSFLKKGPILPVHMCIGERDA